MGHKLSVQNRRLHRADDKKYILQSCRVKDHGDAEGREGEAWEGDAGGYCGLPPVPKPKEDLVTSVGGCRWDRECQQNLVLGTEPVALVRGFPQVEGGA